MPGSRKILLRSLSSSSPVQRPRIDIYNGNSPDSKEGQISAVPSPKHVPIPNIPVDGNLLFESMVFVYAFLGMCLQYINLYKTVWWLENSNSQYAVNFYLINPHLVALLTIIISRRFFWCFCKEFYGWNTKPKRCVFWLMQLIKVIVSLILSFITLYVTLNVLIYYSFVHLLFLCYPLILYFVLFGPSLKPVIDKLFKWLLWSQNDETTTSSTSVKSAKNDAVPKNCVLHNCSASPESIRDEVEVLKTDFNSRVKVVLFNSMLVAYYMGFIPVCFAQHVQNYCDSCWNTLYYDTWRATQHVGLMWVSTFILFMVHFLPPTYIDVLHRSALHLGKWQKVEIRHAHVPYNAWSELQVWGQGTVVKHVRGLFKAEGFNNTAEPGNSTHSRFNFMFYTPLRIVNLLLEVTVAIVVYQFITLIQSTEWCHILSTALLLFCNYYSLFKLLRDRLILGRAYRDEKTLLDKHSD